MKSAKDLDRFLPLTQNIASVWVVNLNVSERNLQSYRGLLSVDEQARADKFKFAHDREKFIVCRGVLRKLSAKYLDMLPNEIQFRYSDFGKPQFAHESTLKFNVSHSGNIALIGFVENQTLGVDVELIKYDFDVSEIARNFFSKKEITALRATPKEAKYLAFYRCWTRKEAFIKAEGSGLSFPLDSFTVSIDSDEKAFLLETEWDLEEKEKWELFSFIPVENYRAALAIRGTMNSIYKYHWVHELN